MSGRVFRCQFYFPGTLWIHRIFSQPGSQHGRNDTSPSSSPWSSQKTVWLVFYFLWCSLSICVLCPCSHDWSWIELAAWLQAKRTSAPICFDPGVPKDPLNSSPGQEIKHYYEMPSHHMVQRLSQSKRNWQRENSLSEGTVLNHTSTNSVLPCFDDLVANFTCEILSCAFPSSRLIDGPCKTIVPMESSSPWETGHNCSNCSGW